MESSQVFFRGSSDVGWAYISLKFQGDEVEDHSTKRKWWK